MASVQDTIKEGTVPLRAARTHDPMIWAFAAALALLFWLPELIYYMGWARFWVQFMTQAFIWSLFAVSFNVLMGYAGMVSFGQAAYLGIGGYTAGLLLKNIAGLSFYVALLAAPVGGAIAALIIGYFIPGIRHLAAYVAGSSKLPLPIFATFASLGAILWTGSFVTIGYMLGDEWTRLSASIHQYALIVAGGVIVSGGVAFLLIRRRRHPAAG